MIARQLVDDGKTAGKSGAILSILFVGQLKINFVCRWRASTFRLKEGKQTENERGPNGKR